MEMEYKDPSKKGRWIVLLGVVLALGAGGAAFFLINNAQQQAGQSGLKTTTAVVAVREIPARKPIEAEDVALRADIPLDGTNAEGVVADPAQVVGRIPAVDVKIGQLVTTNLLASTTAGAEFSILGPDETVGPESEAWRAVSLSVADDRAVGGMLGAGMLVDVFMTASVNVPQTVLDEGTFYTDQSTKISWQNMEILSRQGTFYIVKATLPVAEEISHLQAAGNAQFSMALRPDADARVLDVSSLGATTNRIIQRYGLPVPETYPKSDGPIATAPPIPDITPAPSIDPAAVDPASAEASPSAGATP
ncbi:MAG TPA: SAF domain-containing protein [Candidatus Limnocylindrales bacterium]|nr:SAF domain-containing protein [Candidatus Limnocylindrales bacterium]